MMNDIVLQQRNNGLLSWHWCRL